jgi:hypothetical protein
VLYWIMMVPEMCASGVLCAPNAIQRAVYLCVTQTSCDHLFDTWGSNVDYTRGLTVRLCRFLNVNFGKFPFYELRCISLVSASKKPMEKEPALFSMNA